MGSDETLKAELAKAIAESKRLREENARLRLRIGEAPEGAHQDVERPRSSCQRGAGLPAYVIIACAADVQIALFEFVGEHKIFGRAGCAPWWRMILDGTTQCQSILKVSVLRNVLHDCDIVTGGVNGKH